MTPIRTLLGVLCVTTSWASGSIAAPGTLTCEVLQHIRADYLSVQMSRGTQGPELEIQLLGKPLVDATNADIVALGERYLACQRSDPNFQRSVSPQRYLDEKAGPVAKMVNELASIRDERAGARKASIAATEQISEMMQTLAGFGSLAGKEPLNDTAHLRIAEVEQTARSELEKTRDQRFRLVISEIQSLRERDAALLAARKANAEKERRARSEAAEIPRKRQEVALGLVSIHVLAEFCAEKYSVFTANQVSSLGEAIRKMLDEAGASDNERERVRAAARDGLTQSGMQNLSKRQLESECLHARNAIAPGLPEIFQSN